MIPSRFFCVHGRLDTYHVRLLVLFILRGRRGFVRRLVFFSSRGRRGFVRQQRDVSSLALLVLFSLLLGRRGLVRQQRDVSSLALQWLLDTGIDGILRRR
jgi:hypothetical protein